MSRTVCIVAYKVSADSTQMWGAVSTAQLIARLIALEERNLDIDPPSWDRPSTDDTSLIDDSILPSESDRIQSYRVFKDSFGLYQVRVTRYRETCDDTIYASSENYAI